jgi:hypothetical protein
METGKTGSMTAEEPMMALNKFLENVKYPVTKNDLIEQVRKSRKGESATMEGGNSVLSEMLRHLDMLPDREYKSREDIVSQLGK